MTAQLHTEPSVPDEEPPGADEGPSALDAGGHLGEVEASGELPGPSDDGDEAELPEIELTVPDLGAMGGTVLERWVDDKGAAPIEAEARVARYTFDGPASTRPAESVATGRWCPDQPPAN